MQSADPHHKKPFVRLTLGFFAKSHFLVALSHFGRRKILFFLALLLRGTIVNRAKYFFVKMVKYIGLYVYNRCY